MLAELELLIELDMAKGPKAGVRDTSQPIPGDRIQKKCACGERVFAYTEGDIEPYVTDPSNGSAHSIAKCYHV